MSLGCYLCFELREYLPIGFIGEHYLRLMARVTGYVTYPVFENVLIWVMIHKIIARYFGRRQPAT